MHKIDPMPAERTIWPGVAEMSRTRHRVTTRGQRQNPPGTVCAIPSIHDRKRRQSGPQAIENANKFDTTSKCADPEMQTLCDVGAGLAGRVGVIEAEGAEGRVPDQTGAEGRTDLMGVCNGQRLRQ